MTPKSLVNLQILCDQAGAHHQRGNFAEAERLYLQALALDARNFTAQHLLGIIRAQQGRNAEALALIGGALKARPGDAQAHSNYGNVLKSLGRFADAVASFDRALTIKPDYIGALYNRGNTLQDLNRFEDALTSFDRALTINPAFPEALYNRGNALQSLRRPADALASFDRALAIHPRFAEALNSRGLVLQDLKRFDEALASFDRALAIKPDFPDALNNRGKLLFEANRVEEGLASCARAAALVHGVGLSPPRADEAPHKLRHDREQRDYLAVQSEAISGARLAGPAINPANPVDAISAQWQSATPQVVVIDDFLAPEALARLRLFCQAAPVWHTVYDNGYLGAVPESGFANPLLAQIADEMRAIYPAIFQSHALRYLWGFKYDSQLTGINIHADEAAVNVNFWIAPDDANLDPDHGGLVIWDVAAPADWDFDAFNARGDRIRDFLAQSGAKPTTVPHRANRAVIFNSDLFHETDTIAFRDGYLNRRINITLLYGRRGAPT